MPTLQKPGVEKSLKDLRKVEIGEVQALIKAFVDEEDTEERSTVREQDLPEENGQNT